MECVEVDKVGAEQRLDDGADAAVERREALVPHQLRQDRRRRVGAAVLLHWPTQDAENCVRVSVICEELLC